MKSQQFLETAMDVLLGIVVLILPSALATIWLVWRSGILDAPQSRRDRIR